MEVSLSDIRVLEINKEAFQNTALLNCELKTVQLPTLVRCWVIGTANHVLFSMLHIHCFVHL